MLEFLIRFIRGERKVKIKVNGKTVSVDADKDTIDWDKKDVNIKIDGNSVIIDAKDSKK
jgi:hypothetical protein